MLIASDTSQTLTCIPVLPGPQTLPASTLTAGLAVPVLPGPQLPSQPVLSQQAWQYQYCQASSYPLSQYSHRPGSTGMHVSV